MKSGYPDFDVELFRRLFARRYATEGTRIGKMPVLGTRSAGGRLMQGICECRMIMT